MVFDTLFSACTLLFPSRTSVPIYLSLVPTIEALFFYLYFFFPKSLQLFEVFTNNTIVFCPQPSEFVARNKRGNLETVEVGRRHLCVDRDSESLLIFPERSGWLHCSRSGNNSRVRFSSCVFPPPQWNYSGTSLSLMAKIQGICPGQRIIRESD